MLLVEVGQVAKSGGTGAVFFLDEMQGLEAAGLAAVCMAMNRVGQRGLPVALVAAGLPPLPRLLRKARPYAERLFAYHEFVGEALDRRFFRDRFETASDAEQRYLAAMAELGDGGARTSEAARLAGYKDSTGASVVRDALLRKDLVYSPRRGMLDFTVPLFGGYVRRQHPLASFDEA